MLMKVEPEKTEKEDAREKALFGYSSGTLDPGIRDVVVFLNRHGIKTQSSCEGGDGHAFKFPTVVIKDDDKITADMIAGVFVGGSYAAFTIQHNKYYQDTAWPWKSGAHNFTIEFWRKE